MFCLCSVYEGKPNIFRLFELMDFDLFKNNLNEYKCEAFRVPTEKSTLSEWFQKCPVTK